MRLLQELHLSGTGHILSHEGAKATFSVKCKLRKESTKNVKNGEKCTNIATFLNISLRESNMITAITYL